MIRPGKSKAVSALRSATALQVSRCQLNPLTDRDHLLQKMRVNEPSASATAAGRPQTGKPSALPEVDGPLALVISQATAPPRCQPVPTAHAINTGLPG